MITSILRGRQSRTAPPERGQGPAKTRCAFVLTTVLTALLAAGCASGPENVPDDISAAELVQRGQEASDHYRYEQALQYYQLILDRFGYNIDMVCTAEYEIAFIQYKQKKYQDAWDGLNALLLRYEGPDAELLPPQFKRLSEIVLERISERPGFPPSEPEAQNPIGAE
jgi:hypothetical protein